MLPKDFPQPCQLDYSDERAVMWHMRHLLNLHDLLLLGLDEQMACFRSKLLSVGWGKKKIEEMYRCAAEWTRYEVLVAIDPILGPVGKFHGR